MQVATSGGNDKVSISVIGDKGVSIMSHEASGNAPIEFVVDSPKLWSPDSPNLYNLSIKLGVSIPIQSNTFGVFTDIYDSKRMMK